MFKQASNGQHPVRDKLSSIHSTTNVQKTLSNFQNDLRLLISNQALDLKNVYLKLEEESHKLQKTREAMAKKEKKINSLIDASSDLAWEMDKNFIITYVSPEIFDFLGYKPDEIITTSFTKLISPANEDKIKFHINESIKKQCAFRHLECEVLHKNGKKVKLETNGVPYVSPVGSIQGFVCVSTNINKQKKMELEIFKASKLESMSVLAGGIAHDFNNMLTAINGNIVLAKAISEPGSKIENILNSAQHACRMATGLTRQLLTFSKGGEPVKKIVYIRETIKEAVNFSLRGSNVKCEFDIQDDLLPVEIDEGQICQVVNNLTINAAQAMPDGGMLKMTGENIVIGEHDFQPLSPGSYIKLQIIDHGIGIAEEDLVNIFDPYFTTKEKGNGLGLTVSYAIIKNHGGHLRVKSKKGSGTSFLIYLPTAQENFVKKNKTYNKTTSPDIDHLRILLMDDEDIVLETSKLLLIHLGHEVTTTKNGNEAVTEFITAKKNNRPYSLVILDLTIPGGLGAQDTISRLKLLDPKIKTIVASGYSNAPEMINFADYGFDGAIVKPYDLESLSTMLMKITTDLKMAGMGADR